MAGGGLIGEDDGGIAAENVEMMTITPLCESTPRLAVDVIS